MKALLFILIAITLYSCQTSKQLYCQPMVKTLEGNYKKAGNPYPLTILPGDTVRMLFTKF